MADKIQLTDVPWDDGYDPDDLQCWWSNPRSTLIWPCPKCLSMHRYHGPCPALDTRDGPS